MLYTPENNFGYYIQMLSRKISYVHNRRLEEIGLSMSQFKVLFILYRKGERTQNQLLQELLVKPSTLTGLLSILERKGFVTKRVDLTDARVRKVQLTEEGLNVTEDSVEIVKKMESDVTQSMSPEMKKELVDQLRAVSEAINELLTPYGFKAWDQQEESE